MPRLWLCPGLWLGSGFGPRGELAPFPDGPRAFRSDSLRPRDSARSMRDSSDRGQRGDGRARDSRAVSPVASALVTWAESADYGSP